ncbi:hypothetical protein FCV25MIE_13558 [Fagus crenata]
MEKRGGKEMESNKDTEGGVGKENMTKDKGSTNIKGKEVEGLYEELMKNEEFESKFIGQFILQSANAINEIQILKSMQIVSPNYLDDDDIHFRCKSPCRA